MRGLLPAIPGAVTNALNPRKALPAALGLAVAGARGGAAATAGRATGNGFAPRSNPDPDVGIGLAVSGRATGLAVKADPNIGKASGLPNAASSPDWRRVENATVAKGGGGRSSSIRASSTETGASAGASSASSLPTSKAIGASSGSGGATGGWAARASAMICAKDSVSGGSVGSAALIGGNGSRLTPGCDWRVGASSARKDGRSIKGSVGAGRGSGSVARSEGNAVIGFGSCAKAVVAGTAGAATATASAFGCATGAGDWVGARKIMATATLSRSTFSPGANSSAARSVGPNHGSPLKVPSSGTATKEIGLNRCSAAKAAASPSVSRAITATCTSAPDPDQSKTRSATSYGVRPSSATAICARRFAASGPGAVTVRYSI